MSIFGNKSNFAIECQVSRILDNKLYLNFQLWIDEESIGDYEDEIPLSGCIGYLIDFLKFSDDRYEPDLEDKSKDEVFDKIFNSVIYTFPKGATLEQMINFGFHLDNSNLPQYENIELRFHLDPLGMSSFADKFNIILVETKDKRQRIIWRNLSDLKLHETILKPKTFETIAIQFLEWLKTL